MVKRQKLKPFLAAAATSTTIPSKQLFTYLSVLLSTSLASFWHFASVAKVLFTARIAPNRIRSRGSEYRPTKIAGAVFHETLFHMYTTTYGCKFAPLPEEPDDATEVLVDVETEPEGV